MPRSPLFLTAITGFILGLLLASAGCTEQREALAQAYAAPETLAVRGQLSQKSNAVTTLKHGDRVSIVDVQRRMVKIRTATGFEGWVDSLELLSPEQMELIRRQRNADLALPPEGYATAFETTNIHIEPSRRSPALAHVAEGGSVTVLGRQIVPKDALPTRSAALTFERPQAPTHRPRKEQQSRLSSKLPPRPPPPKPPANWQELSAERIDGVESGKELPVEKKNAPAAKKPEVKRVVMEDWTLVRTKANQVGWVLSRNLQMSIPDDVAQYAEGKRITAFFDLGAVTDEEKGVKHDWLWTTLSAEQPLDFDSWRVFLWNGRHHRYETSYRQRDLEGWFPVEVEPKDPEAPARTFKLITKDDDGKFRRRTYFFDGTRVHLTGTEDYRKGDNGVNQKPGGLDTNQLQSKLPRAGIFKRFWNSIRSRLGTT